MRRSSDKAGCRPSPHRSSRRNSGPPAWSAKKVAGSRPFRGVAVERVSVGAASQGCALGTVLELAPDLALRNSTARMRNTSSDTTKAYDPVRDELDAPVEEEDDAGMLPVDWPEVESCCVVLEEAALVIVAVELVKELVAPDVVLEMDAVVPGDKVLVVEEEGGAELTERVVEVVLDEVVVVDDEVAALTERAKAPEVPALSPSPP